MTLTTSAVVREVSSVLSAQSGRSAPAVIEIDALDLDSPPISPPDRNAYPGLRCCSTPPARLASRQASW